MVCTLNPAQPYFHTRVIKKNVWGVFDTIKKAIVKIGCTVNREGLSLTGRQKQVKNIAT